MRLVVPVDPFKKLLGDWDPIPRGPSRLYSPLILVSVADDNPKRLKHFIKLSSFLPREFSIKN